MAILCFVALMRTPGARGSMYMFKTETMRAEYLGLGEELSKFFRDQKCCTNQEEHFWSLKIFENSSPSPRYSALKVSVFNMYIEPGALGVRIRATKHKIAITLSIFGVFGCRFDLNPHF